SEDSVGVVVTDGGDSYGSGWGDVDNDGDLDLFVANTGENFLYLNDGSGFFSKVNEGVIATDQGTSRGCGWADFDNDGNLDLFVTNDGSENFLYQNDGNQNKWINIKCIGSFSSDNTSVLRSNVSAIGTKVRVTANSTGQLREVSAQTGFGGHGSLNVHFGLGTVNAIESLMIEWPSGATQAFTDTITNTSLIIAENLEPRVEQPIQFDLLTIGNIKLVDLDTVFSDPDPQDAVLTYEATSSDENIADVGIADNLLRVLAVGSGMAAISVVAKDRRGGFIQTDFDVMVNAPPDTVKTIPSVTLKVGCRGSEINLNEIFFDPDDQSLTYVPRSLPNNVASVSIKQDSLLTVTALDTGEATITIEANDNRGGAGITSFVLSALPNQMSIILAEVISDSNSPHRVDHAIFVSAIVLDDEGVKEVMLNFRPSGLSFINVGMNSLGAEGYVGVIPAFAATDRGVEYFLSVEDSCGSIAVSDTAAIQVAVDNVASEIREGGVEQSAYRLFSVPFDLCHNRPDSVLFDDLGPYDDTKWRFLELRSDYLARPNSIYTEFPNTADIIPGKAFWLLVLNEDRIIDTGPGRTNQTLVEYDVPLHPGWNFIGSPFNFPIPLANLHLASGRRLDLRFFDGAWKVKTIGEIMPFEGYAVFSNSSEADVLRINPDLSNVPPNRSKGLSEFDGKDISWSIQIMGQIQSARDIDNLAGVATGSSTGWDRLDLPEPLVVGDYLTVNFPRPEWGKISKKFCSDIRPPLANGEIWEFEVKTNIRDEVKLTFEGIETVPQEYEVWLVDEAVNVSKSLRKSNIYSVAGVGEDHPKRLKLVVGKADFINQNLEVDRRLPTEFQLAQNFPNPFNPATTIPFALPSDESVTIKVYNILGEEVVTLVDDESRKAGFHALVWGGRNAVGRVVASGVYFVRMRAGDFVQTRKMVLMQ
ncbi:ASPIC/UnbV domain-containing protein, partial [bacterium]|nr:ASPIC/UnbV domain-containing protein [bacterium]